MSTSYDTLAHAELARRAVILRRWVETSQHRLPPQLYAVLIQDLDAVDAWLASARRRAEEHPALLGYGPSMMSLDLSVPTDQARNIIKGPHGPLALPGVKDRALSPLRSALPLLASNGSGSHLRSLRSQVEEIQRLIRRAAPDAADEPRPASVSALPALLPIAIQLPGVDRATAFHILALADWLALRQMNDPDALLRALYVLCGSLEHDDEALRRLTLHGNGTVHEAARILRGLADALEPPPSHPTPLTSDMFLSLPISAPDSTDDPDSLAHADDALLGAAAEREPITNTFSPAGPARTEEGGNLPPPFSPPAPTPAPARPEAGAPAAVPTAVPPPTWQGGETDGKAIPLQPLIDQWLTPASGKQASSAMHTMTQAIEALEGRTAYLSDISVPTLTPFFHDHSRSRSTRAAYRRHLRSFVTWLVEHGYLAGWEKDAIYAIEVPHGGGTGNAVEAEADLVTA